MTIVYKRLFHDKHNQNNLQQTMTASVSFSISSSMSPYINIRNSVSVNIKSQATPNKKLISLSLQRSKQFNVNIGGQDNSTSRILTLFLEQCKKRLHLCSKKTDLIPKQFLMRKTNMRNQKIQKMSPQPPYSLSEVSGLLVCVSADNAPFPLFSTKHRHYLLFLPMSPSLFASVMFRWRMGCLHPPRCCNLSPSRLMKSLLSRSGGQTIKILTTFL